jgi:hypothetical protein
VWRLLPTALCLLFALPVHAQSAGRTTPASPLVSRIDIALKGAAHYLVQQQSPDGAWRSQTYGFLKDGPSLTPLVTNCLFFLPEGGKESRKAFEQGVIYLAGMVGKEGDIHTGESGLNFPVLTAASACRVLDLAEPTAQNRHALDCWWRYLKSYRLNRDLGWQPEDPEFGGWGFSLSPPHKPTPGQPRERFCESNLVATLFAIAAVRSVKLPVNDPTYGEILTFVQRCQNFSDDPDRSDPKYDDGGFFFIPGDPVQNKAGVAGKDRFGRERYLSYGSMTADGLRALIRCGLPLNHPRVVAAQRWLERNFTAQAHPGRFLPDRRILGEATYYYYCWAVAHAFLALDLHEIDTKTGKIDWAKALAEELMKRRKADGSWQNRFTASNEDDPLIATCWASSTLAICREELSHPAPHVP